MLTITEVRPFVVVIMRMISCTWCHKLIDWWNAICPITLWVSVACICVVLCQPTESANRNVMTVHKCNEIFPMMTSLGENIFRVTGPLCGEFTGHRWIPLTKASDAGFWYLFDLRLNKCNEIFPKKTNASLCTTVSMIHRNQGFVILTAWILDELTIIISTFIYNINFLCLDRVRKLNKYENKSCDTLCHWGMVSTVGCKSNLFSLYSMHPVYTSIW